jgi:hypothetical protein
LKALFTLLFGIVEFGFNGSRKLGLQERLGAGTEQCGCEGAKLDGHVAPLVVDRIAAIGAGSVRPIAGGEQRRPRRRNQAGDRDRTNDCDRLGKRDDGNVISRKSNVCSSEVRVPNETGDANTGTGGGRE